MQSLIETHLEARTPGLCIITQEEIRALLCISAACKARGYVMHVWSPLDGIREMTLGDQITERPVAPDAKNPPAMLDGFLKLPPKSVLVLPDFHLVDLRMLPLVRKLKDTLWQIKGDPQKTLILLGAEIKLPAELSKELWLLDFKLPTREEILPVLEGTAASIGQSLNGDTDALLDAACGLTLAEAEQAYAISTAETKLLHGARRLDPAIIRREKCQTIRKGGILEIIEAPTRLEDIGGLAEMKEWLMKRRTAFTKEARAYGLPTPKGILTFGVQGCGKSMFAKATAHILGCPLVKMDAGKLFGSLLGSSEASIRTALQTAEAIAPCVLWADELEKGFAGSKSSGQTDGGTTARVLNTFLTWLQEKIAPVFVVATANDVGQLPPELMRKGRFDEIWFVDLPDLGERQDIWRIHITRRGRDPEKFGAGLLASLTDGFTGAEIEAIITDAMFTAFGAGEELTTAHLRAAISATVPLSKMMAAEVDALRKWAAGRARRASAVPVLTSSTKRSLSLN